MGDSVAVLTWNEQLSVGIAELDQQHKQLAEMVNDLYDGVGGRRDETVLQRLLHEMIALAGVHFQTEEWYMRSYGFDGYDRHKGEHAALMAKVHDLKSRIDSGQARITSDVVMFLRNWLQGHILGEDMNYAIFLARQGIPQRRVQAGV